ncbi:hypothetical protein EON64_14500 [archaeon]|nr:MAG: hypothetical protein EON64_14500 [archaeon]
MPRKQKEPVIEATNEEVGMDVDIDLLNVTATSEVAAVEEPPPSYLVELAKSGRADCKKCDIKIEHKLLRVGVIVEGEWGLFTRWQHLDCTIFHKSLTSVDQIDGYLILSPSDKLLVQERFEASKHEVDEDSVPIDPDELIRKSWNQPLEPHADLLMPLLPYQKEGLGWCVAQERSDVHGGILADEMGMGKTIQAIALMLHNRPARGDAELEEVWAASDNAHAHSTLTETSSIHAQLPRAGTLIVLPTVAIRQWQLEIVRFTRESSLRVKVYHGSDRNLGVEDITEGEYDVVITSYKVSSCNLDKGMCSLWCYCLILVDAVTCGFLAYYLSIITTTVYLLHQ